MRLEVVPPLSGRSRRAAEGRLRPITGSSQLLALIVRFREWHRALPGQKSTFDLHYSLPESGRQLPCVRVVWQLAFLAVHERCAVDPRVVLVGETYSFSD